MLGDISCCSKSFTMYKINQQKKLFEALQVGDDWEGMTSRGWLVEFEYARESKQSLDTLSSRQTELNSTNFKTAINQPQTSSSYIRDLYLGCLMRHFRYSQISMEDEWHCGPLLALTDADGQWIVANGYNPLNTIVIVIIYWLVSTACYLLR